MLCMHVSNSIVDVTCQEQVNLQGEDYFCNFLFFLHYLQHSSLSERRVHCTSACCLCMCLHQFVIMVDGLVIMVHIAYNFLLCDGF